MIFFLQKIKINVTILILKLSDGDVPCSISFGVYKFELIQLLEHIAMLQTSTLAIKFQLKLLEQDYQHHKLRKTIFSNYYR